MIFLLHLLIPFFTALGIAPFVISLYKKNKWLDDPTTYAHPKVLHTTPLPRGGGIVIFAAVALGILLFAPHTKEIYGILIGAFILLLLGIWDDIKNPPPLARLGVQLVAAICAVLGGIGISYVTNPFGGIIHFDAFSYGFSVGNLHIVTQPLVWGLAILWIVWCMNSINFSTGLDGQMPGFVAIAALTIAVLTTRFIDDPTQGVVYTLSLIVAGSYLGFLYWNMYPQKMMSGFGASTLAGFFLAILAILSGTKLATAILVLAVPMADAVFVVLKRIQQKKSPFQGDRSHLHHALLDAGMTKKQVAFFYWASAAALGMISLSLSSGQKVFAILLVGVVVCMIAIWLRLFFTQFGKSGRGNG